MLNTLIKFALLLIFFFACNNKNDNELTTIIKPQKVIVEHPMVGPDKFIVTMWSSPPADEANMEILNRDGYSLVQVGQLQADFGEDPNVPVWGPDEYLKRLDIVQKYGLKAQIFSGLFKPENLNNPSNLDLINDLIDKIKNHPALDSYFLADEPSIPGMLAWLRLFNYLKQKDPKHSGYINIFPTYASAEQLGVSVPLSLNDPEWYSENLEGSKSNSIVINNYNAYLKTYIEKINPKLISYDHYHFFNNGVDGPQYFLNLALIRNAAVKYGIPFLNTVQACTIVPTWRLVNENEMRWLAYTTMAYGGRGISWFIYWGPTAYGGMYQDGKRMPLADFAANVNKEIAIIGPELIQLNSTAVYQTSPLPVGSMPIPNNSPVKIKSGQFVLGYFQNAKISNAFMIVNRDYKYSSTAELVLNYGNATLWRFYTTSGKWVEEQKIKTGNVISISLQPGEGALFKVVK
jgi:hypothetical protein